MISQRLNILALLVLMAWTQRCGAFAPKTTSTSMVQRVLRKPTGFIHQTPSSSASTTRQFFFWKDKDDENDSKDGSSTPEEESKSEQVSDDNERRPLFGVFQRNRDEMEADSTGSVATVEEPLIESAAPLPVPAPSSTTMQRRSPPPSSSPPLSPEEQARAMKKQAEKMRLEAERLDAELTLQKIEKLQREIDRARTKGSDSLEQLQKDMDALMKKLRGDQAAPASAPKPSKSAAQDNNPSNSSAASSSGASQTSTSSSATGPDAEERFYSKLDQLRQPGIDEDAIESYLETMQFMPPLMQRIAALDMGLSLDEIYSNATTTTAADDNDDDDDVGTDENGINTVAREEWARRMEARKRYDFSAWSNKPRPSFTRVEIAEKEREIKSMWFRNNIDAKMRALANGNDTELALVLLEYSAYSVKSVDDSDMEEFYSKEYEFEYGNDLEERLNMTLLDTSFEQFYPKCTRKDGQAPSEKDVQQLLTTVLPNVRFAASNKPEQVLGGYLIRGASRYESGDELITAIDNEMIKAGLAGKMTVLFVDDHSAVTDFIESDSDNWMDVADSPPALFVMGPDLVREPKRILLSITSALGIATSWYLSIYPFLLNQGIASRVDEDLALADASMAPDLSWLTELSLPLFITFVAIQLMHEVAHRAVAAAYGMKISVPTFVPSIITGITSAVSTFKTLPKNYEAMFDFSVAGPLAGMAASLLAIAVGSQLTGGADGSLFPALPLVILRQSTLGGGVIEAILGSGSLAVPEGALGSQAIATMNIPLHPVAVAGYISLVVNALAVLPIGTTDGGRIALTLFGRPTKLLIGKAFMFATLLIGLLGSDLFLFYFAFCIAFQPGNEVPARNEVDKVGFSRIGVAIIAYILAFLSLIPFQ